MLEDLVEAIFAHSLERVADNGRAPPNEDGPQTPFAYCAAYICLQAEKLLEYNLGRPAVGQ